MSVFQGSEIARYERMSGRAVSFAGIDGAGTQAMRGHRVLSTGTGTKMIGPYALAIAAEVVEDESFETWSVDHLPKELVRTDDSVVSDSESTVTSTRIDVASPLPTAFVDHDVRQEAFKGRDALARMKRGENTNTLWGHRQLTPVGVARRDVSASPPLSV